MAFITAPENVPRPHGTAQSAGNLGIGWGVTDTGLVLSASLGHPNICTKADDQIISVGLLAFP